MLSLLAEQLTTRPLFFVVWALLLLHVIATQEHWRRLAVRPSGLWLLLSAAGLAVIFFAPATEEPVLFGAGAALLLLSQLWPALWRLARGEEHKIWPFAFTIAALAVAWWQQNAFFGHLSGALLLFALLLAVGTLLACRNMPLPALDNAEVHLVSQRNGAWLLVNQSSHWLRLQAWSPDEDGERVHPLGRAVAPMTALPLARGQRPKLLWFRKISPAAPPQLLRVVPRAEENVED